MQMVYIEVHYKFSYITIEKTINDVALRTEIEYFVT